ncbi:hypothetical protein Vadar_026404 [Vaccinium darrowii]|uniref:Uncharacterized protein n=1 Tax=Vaccinium darrowii TaxID=229202 RepID=A0ACB7Y9I8_9ERIC|nr:hypothetical protein Vadar_026404 [Vaccinium darrowii]
MNGRREKKCHCGSDCDEIRLQLDEDQDFSTHRGADLYLREDVCVRVLRNLFWVYISLRDYPRAFQLALLRDNDLDVRVVFYGCKDPLGKKQLCCMIAQHVRDYSNESCTCSGPNVMTGLIGSALGFGNNGARVSCWGLWTRPRYKLTLLSSDAWFDHGGSATLSMPANPPRAWNFLIQSDVLTGIGSLKVVMERDNHGLTWVTAHAQHAWHMFPV